MQKIILPSHPFHFCGSPGRITPFHSHFHFHPNPSSRPFPLPPQLTQGTRSKFALACFKLRSFHSSIRFKLLSLHFTHTSELLLTRPPFLLTLFPLFTRLLLLTRSKFLLLPWPTRCQLPPPMPAVMVARRVKVMGVMGAGGCC